MSYLKYWLFRRLVYFLLTTAMLQTNRKSPNGEKNKGVIMDLARPLKQSLPTKFLCYQ